MNVTVRDQNGITISVLKGRIETQASDDLATTFQLAAAGAKHKIVLDVAGVDYCSGCALRTMVDVVNSSRERGGDLKLTSLNRKVLRVFRIIGFDSFFSLYDTVEAAVADF